MLFFSLLALLGSLDATPPCFAWVEKIGSRAESILYHPDGLELSRKPEAVYILQKSAGGVRQSFNRWVEDANPIPGSRVLRWRVKYSSITYSELMPSFPFAGMNEMGLQIALVPLSQDIFGRPTEYEDDESVASSESLDDFDDLQGAWLSPFELLQIILDTAASVNQAKSRLRNLLHLPQPIGMQFQIVLCDTSKCRVAVPNSAGLGDEPWRFYRMPKKFHPLVTRFLFSEVLTDSRKRGETAILSGDPALYDFELKQWVALARSLAQDAALKSVKDADDPYLRISSSLNLQWKGRLTKIGLSDEETILTKIDQRGVQSISAEAPILANYPEKIFSPTEMDAQLLAAFRYQADFIRAEQEKRD